MKKTFDKIDSDINIMRYVMILGTLFLFFRVRYGYCFNDEPFVVTLAKHIDDGGALIVNEWHGVQNFGTVVLPFYKLFHLIFGKSNDGILLYFRYIYAVYWSSVCIYVGRFFYKKHDSVLCGIFSYLYLLLFSPLEQNTFSYTSVGLGCALLLCCLLYDIYDGEQRVSVIRLLALCILSTVFALCIPFMAVVYLGLIVILNTIYLKSNDNGIRAFRKYFNTSIPIIALTVIVYLYFFVFSKVSLEQVISCIPYVLNDPEHGKISLFKSLFRMNWVLIRNYGIYLAVVVTTIIILINKNVSDKVKNILFAVCSMIYIVYQFLLARHINNNNHMNFQVFLISVLGMLIFLLLKKKPVLEFKLFFLMSVIYTILDYMSTDSEMMAVSMTSSVFGCFSVVMLILLFKERQENIKFIVIISSILFIQFSTELFFKMYRQYWDRPLYTLTERIDVGACKGLFTCKENKYEYEDMYVTLNDLLDKSANEDSFLLSLCSKPVIYLDSKTKIGSFSSWTIHYGNLFEQRQDTYSNITGVIPDVIFGYNQDDDVYDVKYNISDNYKMKEHNKGYIYIRVD